MMDQLIEARVRVWWEAMDKFNDEEKTKFKEWLNIAEGFLNVKLKHLEMELRPPHNPHKRMQVIDLVLH